MGSLEAMAKGSDARYLSDTQNLKIAQGVSGTVRDKGSLYASVPFLMQAVRQVRARSGVFLFGALLQVFCVLGACCACPSCMRLPVLVTQAFI